MNQPVTVMPGDKVEVDCEVDLEKKPSYALEAKLKSLEGSRDMILSDT